jgi:hypothetical protein
MSHKVKISRAEKAAYWIAALALLISLAIAFWHLTTK